MYEDFYMYKPTKEGRVFSSFTQKYLVHYLRKDGYESVSLINSVTKKKKTVNVHSFVAYFLVDGYEEGKVVNHKNGIKNDNRVENLEWITQKENIFHATTVLGTRDFSNEKHPMYNKKHSEEAKRKMSQAKIGMSGSKHPRSIPIKAINLTTGEEEVFESRNIAAKELGVQASNIYKVLSGERKSTGNYYFTEL